MICATRSISSPSGGFHVWWPLEAPSEDTKVLDIFIWHFSITHFFLPELKSNRSYMGGVGKTGLRYALEKKHHSISGSQGMRL